MKCKVCKSEEFTKSKSGFMTCRNCGFQHHRWEAEEEMDQIKAVKHRRTIQSVSQKVSKGRAAK